MNLVDTVISLERNVPASIIGRTIVIDAEPDGQSGAAIACGKIELIGKAY